MVNIYFSEFNSRMYLFVIVKKKKKIVTSINENDLFFFIQNSNLIV